MTAKELDISHRVFVVLCSKSIRITAKYKMYRQMTDDEEEQCAICLEELGEKPSYRLSEKFGCDCKQKIHEDCLAQWVLRKLAETNTREACCILCREPAGVLEMDEYVRADETAVAIGPANQRQRLAIALAAHEDERERLLALKVRACGIMCVVAILLLSLGGFIS
jgi:hypothetical protein